MDRIATETLERHLDALLDPWALAVVAVAIVVLLSGLGARLLDRL